MRGSTTYPLTEQIRDCIAVHGLAFTVAAYTRRAKRAGVDARTLRLLLIAAHCHR